MVTSFLFVQLPRRSQKEQLVECVRALALCHNVTPVLEEREGGEELGEEVTVSDEIVIFDKTRHPKISYQASSPDEVIIMVSCY